MKLREIVHACRCMENIVYARDPEWFNPEQEIIINENCPDELLDREVEFLSLENFENPFDSIVVELKPMPKDWELNYRVCSVCGEPMIDGYYDGERTGNYYCTDECLHRDYTDEEWQDLYTEDGDSYWTTWWD